MCELDFFTKSRSKNKGNLKIREIMQYGHDPATGVMFMIDKAWYSSLFSRFQRHDFFPLGLE